MILCDGATITAACLPPALRAAAGGDGSSAPDEDLSIKKAEVSIERDLIRRALAKTGGNRTQAAKMLEISHRSLLYKLKEYQID